MQYNEIIEKAEDFSNAVWKHSKFILPHLARFCLISTFFEDGIRIYDQWTEQRDYINEQWNVSIFGTLFCVINFCGQIAGCFMVLARQKVEIGVAILFCIILTQTLAYSVLWNLSFLLRNLALSGGLLLLLAESRGESRSVFAGIPTLDMQNKPKTYMQLTGRLLLLLMYLTCLRFDMNFFHILFNLFGTALIMLVTIGYKTKLSALVMIVFLMAINVYENAFWMVPQWKALRDILKYDFFQTMSVVGGLMFVVAFGPGGVSWDEQKKKW